MKDWFANLAPRERAIFLGGAVIVVLVVVWYGVLRPLQTRSEILRASVLSKQRLLVNLARIDGQPVQTANAGSNQTLVVLVGNTAKEHGVELTRQRPDGPDGIQVTFGNASFDTLVEWLVALETQYAVSVESASFTGTRQQGIVNGQLLLRRS
jgi:general secretion pathway protein M